MRDRRGRVGAWAMAATVAATAALTVGVAWAQDRTEAKADAPRPAEPPALEKDKDKAKPKRRGGLRIPAQPPRGKAAEKEKEKARAAADPLAAAGARPGGAAAPKWPYSVRFRLRSDDTPLTTTYFPSRLEHEAPVVMLIHDLGQSSRDFEHPIAELKDQGLAEYLQAQGYAVLTLDLRGHGANAHRELEKKDGPAVVYDLQAAYRFLIDCHNHGELNLARLGVVAIGGAANLAAAWAYEPGGAVSSEGRVGDLNALVLVSPVEEALGVPIEKSLAALAPRIPTLVIAGERDPDSQKLARAVKPVLERNRLSKGKVELFDTSLHGTRLLRFEPGVAPAVVKFLDPAIKSRREEWEPRYNLLPTSYTDVQLVTKDDAAKKAAPAPAPAKPDAAKKAAPPPQDEAPPAPDAAKKTGPRG